MSIFDRPKFRDLKAEQSAASPVADRTPLMHPEDAPRTARNFPPDFKECRFVESYPAAFPRRDPVTGQITDRKRALIAHMTSTNGDPNGAHSLIDSHYTLRDLIEGGHPEAGKIAIILNMQHESYVVSETGQAAVRTQAQPAQDAKPVVVATSAPKTNTRPTQGAPLTQATV